MYHKLGSGNREAYTSSCWDPLKDFCKRIGMLRPFTMVAFAKFYFQQELHSSRMHTTHLLTVSPNMYCTGGGGLSLPGGVCLASLSCHRRWYPSMHWGRPSCELNHRRLWKYNLAPTSLRAVIINKQLIQLSRKWYCASPYLPTFLQGVIIDSFVFD